MTMNRWMGDYVGSKPAYSRSGKQIIYHTKLKYKIYKRQGGITAPANRFVFTHSRRDTIENAWFDNGRQNLLNERARWVELPHTYHNGAGTLSFADGHAELKRWPVEEFPEETPAYPNLLPRIRGGEGVLSFNSQATEPR